MDNIEKIVYACENDLPVKIEFEDGSIGPHEKIVRYNPEDFTMILSSEHAEHEDLEAGARLRCSWEYVKSVEILDK